MRKAAFVLGWIWAGLSIVTLLKTGLSVDFKLDLLLVAMMFFLARQRD
jgi:hypothetical protein